MHIVAWWLFFLVSVKYYNHNNCSTEERLAHPINMGGQSKQVFGIAHSAFR